MFNESHQESRSDSVAPCGELKNPLLVTRLRSDTVYLLFLILFPAYTLPHTGKLVATHYKKAGAGREIYQGGRSPRDSPYRLR